MRHFAEVERLFREQFREEQGRLVFRRSSKGRPVVVTKQEAEEAIAVFARRNRVVTYGSVGLVIAAVFALALVDDGKLLDVEGMNWLLVIPAIVVIIGGFRWSWYGPTAHFNRRAPVGSERSWREVRAEMLADWSWAKLLGFLVLGLVLVVSRLLDWPPRSLDDWMWLLLGTALLAGTAANALIKWRLSRGDLVGRD